MLEIKNLRRTYTTGGGVIVKALNDVSLNFESTGMVFILGKSGSGKSTLLNVIGGLDKYDSGEIVIKGRSSSTFTSSDFDSYRNTFIGFIFQDYNILEEFTVAKNIALAMELQGKKASREAVEGIIASVDLAGYGNRKPNTLSGGQKQRVAIARALIKEPEIIMADEPTGALDSNTGRQVFDTLKSLSKTKLVIVVSHDREFAEYYGDRVIELADGKIISDVKKYFAPPQEAPGGITVTDNNIITVKRGQALSAAAAKTITDLISRSASDVIISMDDKSNRDFRKIARMDENGNKESFAATTAENTKLLQYDGRNMKLIKSHLPFRDSLKMGASSLKHKPVRLFFTILLSAIAFGLFGLADTMASYNKVSTATGTILDNNINYAAVQRVKWQKSNGYSHADEKKFTPEDVADLKNKTGIDFKPVSGLTARGETGTLSEMLGLKDADSGFNANYHITDVNGVLEVTDSELSSLGFPMVAGSLPSTYTEIVITKYQAEIFQLTGLKIFNEETGGFKIERIASPADMIGKKLHVGNELSFTVSGVADTKFDTEKYRDILDIKTDDMASYLKLSNYQSYMKYNYHCLFFAKPGYFDQLLTADDSPFKEFGPHTSSLFYGKYDEYPQDSNVYMNIRYYSLLTDTLSDDIVWDENGVRTSLSDTEVVLSVNALNGLQLLDQDGNPINAGEYTDIYFATMRYAEENFETDSEKEGFPIDEIWHWEYYAEALSGRYDDYKDWMDSNPYGLSGRQILQNSIAELSEEYLLGKTVTIVGWDNDTGDEILQHCKVVGAYTKMPDENDTYRAAIIANSAVLAKVEKTDEGIYSYCIAAMPTDKSKVTELVKMGYDDSGTFGFVLRNPAVDSLSSVNDMIKTLSSAFLYVGIGFAVFAALMLMNFISTSIAYKKREIGILRAVGARGSDVFGIFFNESLIIALINYIVSVALAIVGCILLNNLIISMGLDLKILVFGIRQLGLMLAVCIGVAFLSSFLPTKRISSKKPIDAIQNR